MIRPEVIQKFVSIVGKDRCKTSPEDLLTHSYDASILEFVPDAILFPVSTEEVSRIMALASAENVFVTPRGSASGLGGECLAKKGGILFRLRR